PAISAFTSALFDYTSATSTIASNVAWPRGKREQIDRHVRQYRCPGSESVEIRPSVAHPRGAWGYAIGDARSRPQITTIVEDVNRRAVGDIAYRGIGRRIHNVGLIDCGPPL